MKRWTRSALLVVVCSASFFRADFCATSYSQDLGVVSPGSAEIRQSQVESVLDKGRELEEQRSWGEAVSHYEEAVREFPREQRLLQRLTRARLYFDVERRSTDESYLSLLQTISQQQAMELLAEVMLKIQSNYVVNPDWNAMLRTGTTSLGIALNDAQFQRLNRVRPARESTRSLVQQVWQSQIRRDFRSRQQAQDFIQWVAQRAERATGITPSATVLEYTCGAMSALDSYSGYLTGEQLDEVYSQIEGNFVGLGLELKSDQGTLLIADVIPDGPADRSGMRAGDRIFEVDGQLTKDISTDKAADMLKGDQGSVVSVRVLTATGDKRRFSVRRERVEVPSVEQAKIIDPQQGIAYIKINSFQKTTTRDVDIALWRLHGLGMRMLIVDVRGNPGGLLTESVEVADRFLSEGTIVETRGRNARENYGYKAHRAGTWQVPLIVLIDGESASASEIFAAAIHDHRRGTVVGERSYGKGSVQGIFPLQVAKAGIRLTTAKFYSPAMHAISDGGIEPDVVVRSAAKPTELGETVAQDDDKILQAGIDVARRLMAQRHNVSSHTER
jgi:carboxyl-terminal processing protease